MLHDRAGPGPRRLSPAGRRFLQGLRARADAHGALLVFDEIQTGFGRTGDWFAAGTYGVEPGRHDDGQGARRRLSPVVDRRRAPTSWRREAGDHGSTFGGNPVPCAAALAGIDAMDAEGLPEHARILGERAMRRLTTLQAGTGRFASAASA